MVKSRRVWRWLGILWVVTGVAVTLAMMYVGGATLVDLGWRGRAVGAFLVSAVAIAMTALGVWTVRAEFGAEVAAPGRSHT